MRRNTLAAVTLAVVGSLMMPAALAAQTPGRERAPHMMRGGAPAERIIEHRAELGLTDAQVAQLRQIGTELEAQNRPLIEQLEAAHARIRAERPQLSEEQREEQRERRRAMADSMRSTVRAMTPEQRAQMRERMQQRRAEGDSAQRPMMQMGRPHAIPDELKPVMEQLRTNTQSAMQRIRSTLTAEQQEKLRNLRQATRRDGMRGAGMQRHVGPRSQSAPRGTR